jgi:hypothetical protein
MSVLNVGANFFYRTSLLGGRPRCVGDAVDVDNRLLSHVVPNRPNGLLWCALQHTELLKGHSYRENLSEIIPLDNPKYKLC